MGEDGTWFAGGLSTVGLTARLDDLKDLLQPKCFYDSTIYTQIISLFIPLGEKFCCLNIFPHSLHLSAALCHWLTRLILFDLIQFTREFLSLVFLTKSAFSP